MLDGQKQLNQFPATLSVSGSDLIYSANTTSGIEQRTTVTQLQTYVLSGIATSNLQTLPVLIGTETVPLGKSGLFQTTLNAIAAFTLKNISNGSLTAATGLTGAETVPVSQGGALVQTTTSAIANLAISAIAPARQSIPVMTAGQSLYVSNGYVPALLNVFVAGFRLNPYQYQAVDGINVTITDATILGIIVPGMTVDIDAAVTVAVSGVATPASVAALDPSNQPAIGSFTGTELFSTRQGATLFQSTLTKMAQWVVGTFQGFTQTGTGAVARSIDGKLFDASVSVHDFGAVGDGVANDTVAIQAGINAVSAAGGGVLLLYKPMYRASGLILKTGVVLESRFKESVIIKAPDGWANVSVIETYNFDIYKKSAGNPTDANTPDSCGLRDITIDGNAENFAGVPSATSGYCVRMGATRMVLDNVRIQAAPATGLHTSLGAITRLTTDWYRRNIANGYVRNLSIYASRNDNWVHDGPQDLYIESADLGIAGFPDTAAFVPNTVNGGNTIIGFPSYLEPLRRVSNYTQNCAAEIGWMHSFGCTQGYAMVVGAATNGTQAAVRLKFTTLILESSNGGLWTRQGVNYQGDVLDIHNCYGVDGQAFWLDNETAQEGHINNVRIYVQANNHGQDLVQLYGQHKSIGFLGVEGTNFPSTAIAFDGQQNKVLAADINQCRKTSGADGTVSAIRINATCAEWQCNAYVRNSDLVATYLPTSSTARPIDSTIVSAFGNYIPGGGTPAAGFVGFGVLSTSYRRNILLQSLSSDMRSRNYKVVSSVQTIPSGTYTPGSTLAVYLTIAGIIAPNPEEIEIAMIYGGGGIPQVQFMVVQPTAISATQIVVLVAFTAAATLNFQISASVS